MISFVLLVLFAFAQALQFSRVNQTAGHTLWTSGLGMDFTVTSAIDVSAIGIIDADAPGISGTLTAQIVDRSNDRVAVGPVSVSQGQGDARANDSNPFVFKPMPSVRLAPGVYCLTSIGFIADKVVTTGTGGVSGSVVVGDSGGGAVLVTGAVNGGSDLLSSTQRNYAAGPDNFHAGATFVFSVAVSRPAVSPPLRTVFPDCEAVACAGLPTGDYHIGGQLRFCDNDMAGGGWMRLWRANETSCESNGWSSARNPFVAGVDPMGCRAAPHSCRRGLQVDSPFTFNEIGRAHV